MSLSLVHKGASVPSLESVRLYDAASHLVLLVPPAASFLLIRVASSTKCLL